MDELVRGTIEGSVEVRVRGHKCGRQAEQVRGGTRTGSCRFAYSEGSEREGVEVALRR